VIKFKAAAELRGRDHCHPVAKTALSLLTGAREAVRVLRPAGGFLFLLFASVSSYGVATTATRSQKLPCIQPPLTKSRFTRAREATRSALPGGNFPF
jgi:hypothetical protein